MTFVGASFWEYLSAHPQLFFIGLVVLVGIIQAIAQGARKAAKMMGAPDAEGAELGGSSRRREQPDEAEAHVDPESLLPGFLRSGLWEEAKKKGDKMIKPMIDNALQNTSVTVVFVNYGTANRKYIDYEIDKSLVKGNGLVAIQIHHLKDSKGNTGSPGAIPDQIEANGFKAYKYTNKEALATSIEEAATIVGK